MKNCLFGLFILIALPLPAGPENLNSDAHCYTTHSAVVGEDSVLRSAMQGACDVLYYRKTYRKAVSYRLRSGGCSFSVRPNGAGNVCELVSRVNFDVRGICVLSEVLEGP